MATYTKELLTFLRGVKVNNNKPWFDAHRDQYNTLRPQFEADVQRFILAIAKFDPSVKHQVAKQAMYRINRDIRFSHNKQPYKTNFGAGIGPGGKKGELPGYHLHIDADGTMMVAGGLYMITPQQTDHVRTAIARNPQALKKIITAPSFKRIFGGLDDEEKLKRPPRGYDADHPAIELLKLKHFVAWAEEPVGTGDWVPRAVAMAKVLHPLISYLQQVSA